ncbi:unnamed protein product, partial [Medioppia subpectinata]
MESNARLKNIHYTSHENLPEQSPMLSENDMDKIIEEYFTKNDQLESMAKIGVGAFGTVIKVKDRNDNRIYALKITTSKGRSNECKILADLDHPCIVKYYNSRLYSDKWLVIQMGYCEMTLKLVIENKNAILKRHVGNKYIELFDYIISWQIYWEIVSVLRYLHHHAKVLHLDIKPSNILCDPNLSHGTLIKIADFGLSIKYEDISHTYTDKCKGSPGYMADENERGKYTPASDVFSFGQTMAHLFNVDMDLEYHIVDYEQPSLLKKQIHNMLD